LVGRFFAVARLVQKGIMYMVALVFHGVGASVIGPVGTVSVAMSGVGRG
jgi:hypothetical protein